MDRTAARPSSAWSRLRRFWRNALGVGERTKTVARAYADANGCARFAEFAVLLESPKEAK